MAFTTKTVLGKVIGTKDVRGQWAGRSKIPLDAPAVTTTPIPDDGAPPAAKPPAGGDPVVSKPTTPKPVEPAKEPPAVSPKPPASASGAGDDEKKANRLLALGKNYLASGLKPLAAKKFQEILKKYPKTQAAEQAEVKLEECQ